MLRGCVDTKKKVPSASLVKMTLWTFVEAQITNIEMKHDANLADISVCVPPAQGIMFYFNFGEWRP